jgi:hypothetical protein
VTYIAVIVVAVLLASIFFLFLRKASSGIDQGPAVEERTEPAKHYIYSIGEVEVYKHAEDAEIRTSDGISVELSADAAKQVHYYSAPIRDCTCSCEGNPDIESKEGYVIGAARPDISRDSLVIGNKVTRTIQSLSTGRPHFSSMHCCGQALAFASVLHMGWLRCRSLCGSKLI